MCKVSIIIPVYNVEEYLSKCISSVLSQKYRDFELLLIDDGSTDNSYGICLDYAQRDSRIRVIKQKNGGPSKARNHGINESLGEFITFIDSDDYVSDSYLSDLMTHEADVVASGFDVWYAYNDSHNICTFDQLYHCDAAKGNISKGILIGEYNHLWKGPCAKMYRKSIILEHSLYFPESLKYGEDHLFNLSFLAYADSIVLLPVCNYTYTHYGKQSLTNRRVPYEEMFSYIKLVHHQRILLHEERLKDLQYLTFIKKEAYFYFWQTIYTLFLTEANSAKRKVVFFSNMEKLGKDIVFMSAPLPLMYRTEKLLLKFAPFTISDKLLLFILRFKHL